MERERDDDAEDECDDEAEVVSEREREDESERDCECDAERDCEGDAERDCDDDSDRDWVVVSEWVCEPDSDSEAEWDCDSDKLSYSHSIGCTAVLLLPSASVIVYVKLSKGWPAEYFGFASYVHRPSEQTVSVAPKYVVTTVQSPNTTPALALPPLLVYTNPVTFVGLSALV